MDYYEAFYRTFLEIVPEVSYRNNFDTQLATLQQELAIGQIMNYKSSIFQLTTNDTERTYWVANSDASEISIIVKTIKYGNYIKVEWSSKNPNILVENFISDLYLTICNTIIKTDLIFGSNDLPNNEAKNLWKKLSINGNIVSVYDRHSDKYILTPIPNEQEFLDCINDLDKNRYVFVLPTSIGKGRGTITSFVIMEIKHSWNWPMFNRYINKE